MPSKPVPMSPTIAFNKATRSPTARPPRQIGLGRAWKRQSGCCHQTLDLTRLALPGLHNQNGAGGKDTRSLRDQGAVGIEPVGAAIERGMRIVVAYLGRKARNIGGADI